MRVRGEVKKDKKKKKYCLYQNARLPDDLLVKGESFESERDRDRGKENS